MAGIPQSHINIGFYVVGVSVQRFCLSGVLWCFAINYYFAYKMVPEEKIQDGQLYYSFTKISETDKSTTRNAGLFLAFLIGALSIPSVTGYYLHDN